MEYIINESGCNSLCQTMENQTAQIEALISEIEAKEPLLKAALGEDYETIAKTIRVMKEQVDSAKGELGVIISSTKDYLQRVQQVRIALDK